MNSIAIIDKHPVVRVGLREFVAQHFENAIIIESDNLLKYIENCSARFPDIVILGNTMELFNSVYQSIAEIKRKCRDSQIIIFDESPDHIKIVRSFKAGAKGYLTKFSDMQELYKCICMALQGRIYVCHDALGLILPSHQSHGTGSKRNRASLSPTEYDVAHLLAAGYTISSIEKKMEVKATTIRTLKRRIFKKLNITQMVDLKESFKGYLENQNEAQQSI